MHRLSKIFAPLFNLTFAVLIVIAVYALSPDPNAPADPVAEAEPEMIIIGPGIPGHDPCTVQVHPAVLPNLEEIGIREWSENCVKKHAKAADLGDGDQENIKQENNE